MQTGQEGVAEPFMAQHTGGGNTRAHTDCGEEEPRRGSVQCKKHGVYDLAVPLVYVFQNKENDYTDSATGGWKKNDGQ